MRLIPDVQGLNTGNTLNYMPTNQISQMKWTNSQKNKLLKMIQEDTENPNTPITSKVTELLI